MLTAQGYNIQNFDIPYLLNRASALHILESFSDFSRDREIPVTMKQGSFQSKAFGKRDRWDIQVLY